MSTPGLMLTLGETLGDVLGGELGSLVGAFGVVCSVGDGEAVSDGTLGNDGRG